MNPWLFFGAVLLGALIGTIVTNWINSVALDLGQKEMMKDGDLFIRKNGKWYPHNPHKSMEYIREKKKL